MTTRTFPTIGDPLPGEAFQIAETEGKQKVVYLSDGNSAHIRCEDPYGFWRIFYVNGRTPEAIKSQRFTSAGRAEQALSAYLEKEKYNTVISPEPVVIPQVKYKNVKTKTEIV